MVYNIWITCQNTSCEHHKILYLISSSFSALVLRFWKLSSIPPLVVPYQSNPPSTSSSASLCSDTLDRLFIVLQTAPRPHALPLIRQVHWLPYRFSAESITRYYSCADLQDPQHHRTNLVTTSSCVSLIRSSDVPQLVKPFTTTEFGKRPFRCCAPSVWNSLPA